MRIRVKENLPERPHGDGVLDGDSQTRGNEDRRVSQQIEWITQDLNELEMFYNILSSPTRKQRLEDFFDEQLKILEQASFDSLSQDGKVDFLLLRNYLLTRKKQLQLDSERDAEAEPLLPFAGTIIKLCEARQRAEFPDSQGVAQDLTDALSQVLNTQAVIRDEKLHVARFSAYRAANIIDQLSSHLEEWFNFYNGYDPMFSWWIPKPFEEISTNLTGLSQLIREKIVGIKPGEEDAIIGEPIGTAGLAADLEAEKIPYTPEELIKIGEQEYAWCETEIIKASRSLGYGDDWRAALEHVKTLYVAPGEQPLLVHRLSREAITYVQDHDLVTIPPLASETIKTYMMSPARQLVNPFFLGGTSIIISYPTSSMSHEAKQMSLRGNNIHFSRSTVFHELIPGHHLQLFMNDRHAPYRRLFRTPFSIEGWAFYWEMILWDDERFHKTAENRIGMLFWRMHRCARIIFSINFHLGRMTPQECIDLLVEKVGHERATAEGEVRRSFNGDYGPLYQCAYMLGALQFYALRKEVLGETEGGMKNDTAKMTDKTFHDTILRANQMPIEFLRALLIGEKLERDYEAKWKFYEFKS